jgi:hypothetical protein
MGGRSWAACGLIDRAAGIDPTAAICERRLSGNRESFVSAGALDVLSLRAPIHSTMQLDTR